MENLSRSIPHRVFYTISAAGSIIFITSPASMKVVSLRLFTALMVIFYLYKIFFYVTSDRESVLTEERFGNIFSLNRKNTS